MGNLLSLDMVKNFMDLSDDNCMNLFTQGQVDRMRAQFAPGGFRESILHSIGLSPKSEEEEYPQEATCPAPYDVAITFNQGYFLASWEGQAEEYIFELKLPIFEQWIGISRTQTSISGYIPGFYTFEARVKSICEGEESKWSVFPASTSGRNGHSITKKLFQLSPNPARDQVRIEWPMAELIFLKEQSTLQTTRANLQVDIFNVNGQQIFQRTFDRKAGMASLEVNDWVPGVYFVVFSNPNGQVIYRTKMIVQ